MSFKCVSGKHTIKGMNCAYTLSSKCNVPAKSNSHIWCTCGGGGQGYPIRAKEIRDYYFSDLIDSNKSATDDAYIYCENSTGQGHVYYGTFNKCTTGNGNSAQQCGCTTVFKRYRYFS